MHATLTQVPRFAPAKPRRQPVPITLHVGDDVWTIRVLKDRKHGSISGLGLAVEHSREILLFRRRLERCRRPRASFARRDPGQPSPQMNAEADARALRLRPTTEQGA